MSRLNALKKALGNSGNQTGTVIEINGGIMRISTQAGTTETAAVPSVQKGDRITIKNGVITPLNRQKTPVFNL